RVSGQDPILRLAERARKIVRPPGTRSGLVARSCCQPAGPSNAGNIRDTAEDLQWRWAGVLVGSQPPTRVAARSAMASTVALVLAPGMEGITEASATRRPSMPCTRS